MIANVDQVLYLLYLFARLLSLSLLQMFCKKRMNIFEIVLRKAGQGQLRDSLQVISFNQVHFYSLSYHSR